jgi:predicted DNA-binding protein YlxM (UPF0122 family)
MENKTIVQQLKGYFEQQLSLHEDGEIKYTTKEALEDAVEVCKKAISVEKKQLVRFPHRGNERWLNFRRRCKVG